MRKGYLFSAHLEFACKQRVHVEMRQVLNRYRKGIWTTVRIGTMQPANGTASAL